MYTARQTPPRQTPPSPEMAIEAGGRHPTGMHSCFMYDLCLQFGCCGINGGDDYLEAKKWDRERVVEVQNTDQNVTLETPFSCCKVEGTFPNVEPVDEKCAVDPSAANNNKDIVSMIHPIAPYFCPSGLKISYYVLWT